MSLSIRPFQPRDLAGVLRVLAQAMHADAIPEWRFVRQVLLDANFRPEGAPVAVRRDNVLGFSHYENERFGPIGVAAAHAGGGWGRC